MAEVTSGDGLTVVILDREEITALRRALQLCEDGETLPQTLTELADAIGVELWADPDGVRPARKAANR
jgi:prophage tail gpP-like protein